jgi:lipopolysaccharide export system permease protein
MNQRTDEGQAIINAAGSRDQGINLNGVSIYVFDIDGRFKQRIEARAAVLVPGAWLLRDTRIYVLGTVPTIEPEYRLKTSLTPEQVPRKLCHTRNGPILGSSRVYPDR